MLLRHLVLSDYDGFEVGVELEGQSAWLPPEQHRRLPGYVICVPRYDAEIEELVRRSRTSL